MNSHTVRLLILISFAIVQPYAISHSIKNSAKSAKKMKEPEAITLSKFNDFENYYPLSDEDKLWVEQIFKKLTLKEKAAQLVMPWATGNFTNESSPDYRRLVRLVKDQKVGGVIFFKGDIVNEAILINKLQKEANVPLLISSDFERGLAMRLTDALEFPYNMAIAATNDPALAFEFGKAISLESRTMGVHQNYAPVADINNNPQNPIINIRSFSEDKDIVTKFTTAFIEGTRAGGMLSTVKHFPGHGNTSIDSHKDMPTINGKQEELEENELVPFIESINSGVTSVMVGHLNVPAFDGTNVPATLSKDMVNGLLKEKMGFKGLVVTDAMNMSAITKYYSTAEATVLAIKAGVDLILMPPDEDVAINAIHSAVINGEISEERLNESVIKLLTMKKWLKIDQNKYSNLDDVTKIISSKEHKELAQKIADRSITLVKNDINSLPLLPGTGKKIAMITINEGYNSESAKMFSSYYEYDYGHVDKITLTRNNTPAEYANAMEIARQADIILMPSYIRVRAYQGTVQLSEGNIKFINKVIALQKPTVIMSFGNPYMLSLFPEANTYLTAYGDAPVSQAAMLKAIMGQIPIRGKLPISIPNTPYKVGYGLNSNFLQLADISIKDKQGI